MSYRVAIMAVVLLALSYIVPIIRPGPGNPPPASGITVEHDCEEPRESALVDAINKARADNGVPTVYDSDTLSASAEHMAQDLARYNHFEHYLYDGTSWSQNQRNHGYTYNAWRGQAIAAQSSDPTEIVNAWLNSPDHRGIILDPHYTVVGSGYTPDADATLYSRYWVADFGSYPDAPANVC